MKTIFAVDDSPTARASIEYTLKKGNYNILMAENGVAALDKLTDYSGDVDLFIFDINMPEMDGITLTKKVRELPEYRYTPILILTTESQDGMKMQGKKAGASGWIVKPFEPEQLLSLAERFVG